MTPFVWRAALLFCALGTAQSATTGDNTQEHTHDALLVGRQIPLVCIADGNPPLTQSRKNTFFWQTRFFIPILFHTVHFSAGKSTPMRLLLLVYPWRDDKRHMQSTRPMHCLFTRTTLEFFLLLIHLPHPNREEQHSDTISFASFASKHPHNTTSARRTRLQHYYNDKSSSPAHSGACFVHVLKNSTCRPGSRQMYIANCTVPDDYFCLGL